MLNVFDIAATENTGFFISYYPFVDRMEPGYIIFTSYLHKKINVLFEVHCFIEKGCLVDLVWVGVFPVKQTNKRRPGNLPSFFLSQRKKNKMSWKTGHAFTAKYMSSPVKESSPEVDFETVSQVYTTANIFWKREQNIHTMMTAIMDPHGRKVSRYYFSELSWTRIYGKTHLISKHRAC